VQFLQPENTIVDLGIDTLCICD